MKPQYDERVMLELLQIDMEIYCYVRNKTKEGKTRAEALRLAFDVWVSGPKQSEYLRLAGFLLVAV